MVYHEGERTYAITYNGETYNFRELRSELCRGCQLTSCKKRVPMPILTGSIARPLPKSPDSKARRRWLPKWEMKTVDGIEKGILRRAFARRATREWTLELLDDANAPVQPLLNTRVVRELAESDAPLPPNMVVSPFERIIQMNEWLKKYEVTLSL